MRLLLKAQVEPPPEPVPAAVEPEPEHERPPARGVWLILAATLLAGSAAARALDWWQEGRYGD